MKKRTSKVHDVQTQCIDTDKDKTQRKYMYMSSSPVGDGVEIDVQDLSHYMKRSSPQNHSSRKNKRTRLKKTKLKDVGVQYDVDIDEDTGNDSFTEPERAHSAPCHSFPEDGMDNSYIYDRYSWLIKNSRKKPKSATLQAHSEQRITKHNFRRNSCDDADLIHSNTDLDTMGFQKNRDVRDLDESSCSTCSNRGTDADTSLEMYYKGELCVKGQSCSDVDDTKDSDCKKDTIIIADNVNSENDQPLETHDAKRKVESRQKRKSISPVDIEEVSDTTAIFNMECDGSESEEDVKNEASAVHDNKKSPASRASRLSMSLSRLRSLTSKPRYTDVSTEANIADPAVTQEMYDLQVNLRQTLQELADCKLTSAAQLAIVRVQLEDTHQDLYETQKELREVQQFKEDVMAKLGDSHDHQILSEKISADVQQELDTCRTELESIRSKTSVLERKYNLACIQIAEEQEQREAAELESAFLTTEKEDLYVSAMEAEAKLAQLREQKIEVEQESEQYQSLYLETKLQCSASLGSCMDDMNAILEENRTLYEQLRDKKKGTVCVNSLQDKAAQYCHVQVEKNKLRHQVDLLSAQTVAQDMHIENLHMLLSKQADMTEKQLQTCKQADRTEKQLSKQAAQLKASNSPPCMRKAVSYVTLNNSDEESIPVSSNSESSTLPPHENEDKTHTKPVSDSSCSKSPPASTASSVYNNRMYQYCLDEITKAKRALNEKCELRQQYYRALHEKMEAYPMPVSSRSFPYLLSD